MVAPRPREPLVLFLAATPYSASVGLVAVRKERQASAAVALPAEAEQGPEGLAETMTAAEKDQPRQESAPGAEEAPSGDQGLRAAPPQAAPRPPEDAGRASTLNLVEHPVYFPSPDPLSPPLPPLPDFSSLPLPHLDRGGGNDPATLTPVPVPGAAPLPSPRLLAPPSHHETPREASASPRRCRTLPPHRAVAGPQRLRQLAGLPPPRPLHAGRPELRRPNPCTGVDSETAIDAPMIDYVTDDTSSLSMELPDGGSQEPDATPNSLYYYPNGASYYVETADDQE
ncbi:ESX-1 secretion-associated protein EspI [Triticum aestivum]|uniref:ESX-1 secretion-associated protein EspI n=1 Tax=Triticum aestivum TaxID=4565 RepID=UPI001D030A04|nr:ESX-1 secretion-associated protein EspI-like [Triticum aestivum]